MERALERLLRLGWLEGLGRNVIVLGFVSLLTDISSEMLYPVVPLFLTEVLRAPMSIVGLIEGIAESTASLLKVVAGWWSDRVGKRRPMVIAGYGASAISKPLLALAGTWHLVLFSRVIDRIGKGIRNPPRDAMIAASCDAEHRGKGFGLHRAMDTLGASLGPVAAVGLLALFHGSYRPVFVLAFIPAALGVAVLALFTHETPVKKPSTAQALAGRGALTPELKRLLLVLGVFALGNSSDVFLLLRAKDVGFTPTAVLWVYVFYNIVYALTAGPAGTLSDRLGRRRLMIGGLIAFAVVYFGFALGPGRAGVWVLFTLYGLYAAATEGIAKAYVADLSTPQNRGTAMGLLDTVRGITAFVASAVAGLLWTHVHPAAPFVYGAVCALAAAGMFHATLAGVQAATTSQETDGT
jgi:MFS family permease